MAADNWWRDYEDAHCRYTCELCEEGIQDEKYIKYRITPIGKNFICGEIRYHTECFLDEYEVWESCDE